MKISVITSESFLKFPQIVKSSLRAVSIISINCQRFCKTIFKVSGDFPKTSIFVYTKIILLQSRDMNSISRFLFLLTRARVENDFSVQHELEIQSMGFALQLK